MPPFNENYMQSSGLAYLCMLGGCVAFVAAIGVARYDSLDNHYGSSIFLCIIGVGLICIAEYV